MAKALVLGAGMVGQVMAADLARSEGLEVTVADRDPAALAHAAARGPVRTTTLDLSDFAGVARAAAPFDIVCGAGPSHLGFELLRTMIEAGKPYVDISFMPEDALDLDELAKSKGVCAVVDCGVAPGLSNMLSGRAHAVLAPMERLEILVGGLPVERRWPFEYKAGFAPSDVIEEYTRPARLVEHGREVVREALSEPELVDLPGVGTLESFNTDGLRSLARTLDAPFMKEKTLRYPGHIELMRVLRAMGLFSEEPVEVNGAPVIPRDMTAALMFPMWTYEEHEADLTVMRVVAEGGGVRLTWDLLDSYDAETNSTSMARTTAFPCASVARMISRGDLSEAGVHAPERLGADERLLRVVLDDLEARGVKARFEEAGA